MNNAPKLSLSIRLGTSLVAVAVTFVIVQSMDAVSNRYVQQGAAHAATATANVNGNSEHA